MNLKRLTMLLMLVMVFALSGCGTNADSVEAKGVESDKLEEKVVIYSTHGESMLELVASRFEEETGVKVEFINLKGELADRVRAEKTNPQSDVMFGGASSLFMALKEEELFQAYEPSWGSSISELFKDTESYWFGTIQTPVMMFYNSDMLNKEDAPKDWSDLVKPEYKDQLVFRNALSSSARATYSSLLLQFENKDQIDDGWAYMKELDANTKAYYSSGSLMIQALGRKEASISFAPLNAVIDNKIKNNIPLEVIDAESGSPIITDGIAMINGAPHPNAAKAFIEFAGSAEIQAALANEFNRLPTHPDAIASSPEWMGEIKCKPMDVDWKALSKKESEWMQTWDLDVKASEKEAK